VQAVTAEDVIAPNDREQLAEADACMQDRIHQQIRAGGVTIVTSAMTYVEAGTTVGTGSIIQPFTFIGRDSNIGPDCTIGPFAVIPRESLVPEGSTVAGNVSPENAVLTQQQS
jgi:bifunctional UDP-N-acetylglucosamine pyrophosphorylase/glucosamine-1-phosphate N-acetyltransferase